MTTNQPYNQYTARFDRRVTSARWRREGMKGKWKTELERVRNTRMEESLGKVCEGKWRRRDGKEEGWERGGMGKRRDGKEEGWDVLV
ncbi:hypothetical protein Pmani_019266 [Petrolisthes manimaculis]|uniref:Uncharacterized protein n=1 Tax=Petrolisthes manimaculis TaxID=1843537 RepID=A0AAE1PKT0_9EUCA|nr:hypothetical protein Pmani_019266 [Petrolisthes manimaculis]